MNRIPHAVIESEENEKIKNNVKNSIDEAIQHHLMELVEKHGIVNTIPILSAVLCGMLKSLCTGITSLICLRKGLRGKEASEYQDERVTRFKKHALELLLDIMIGD